MKGFLGVEYEQYVSVNPTIVIMRMTDHGVSKLERVYPLGNINVL